MAPAARSSRGRHRGFRGSGRNVDLATFLVFAVTPFDVDTTRSAFPPTRPDTSSASTRSGKGLGPPALSSEAPKAPDSRAAWNARDANGGRVVACVARKVQNKGEQKDTRAPASRVFSLAGVFGSRRVRFASRDSGRDGRPRRRARDPREGHRAGEGCRGEGQSRGLRFRVQAVHVRSGPLHHLPQVREESDDAADRQEQVHRVPRARGGAQAVDRRRECDEQSESRAEPRQRAAGQARKWRFKRRRRRRRRRKKKRCKARSGAPS